MTAIVLFWVFFALALYPFVIYPALLGLLALGARRPKRDESYTPKVSVVVAAWNEEALISRRLDNLLASDYPEDRLEIIIASDGSTDRTNEIVAEYAERDGRVRLLALEHHGKTPTVNAGVAAATGDVVISSDAGTAFAEDTIRKLAAPFADEAVDCVVGELNMVPVEDAPYNRGEGAYWRFEAWLRYLESRAGVGFQGCGPCMAIRREEYPTLPGEGSDDLSAPLQIAHAGGRVIQLMDVGVTDYMDGGTGNQMQSRCRRVVRALRSISYSAGALNPFRCPRTAFAIISHKILRWLTGIWMLGMLVTSAWLWWREDILLYDALFYAQAAFYLLALMGYLLSNTRLAKNPVLSVPLAICIVALAFLGGIIEFLRGRSYATWQPTASGAAEPDQTGTDEKK
ncbi:MAG: glycosyltransferase [Armatimonadota bacterium]|jgi:glycosyltransferase involved in cell wall biosynthesis